jgi:hypothetical protein
MGVFGGLLSFANTKLESLFWKHILLSKHEKVSLVSAKGNIGMTAVVDQGKGNETIDSILLDDLLEVFNLEQVVIKMDVLEQEDIVLNGGDEFFNKIKFRLFPSFYNHVLDVPGHQVLNHGRPINRR